MCYKCLSTGFVWIKHIIPMLIIIQYGEIMAKKIIAYAYVAMVYGVINKEKQIELAVLNNSFFVNKVCSISLLDTIGFATVYYRGVAYSYIL